MQCKLLNRGAQKTFALILEYGEDPMEEIKKFAAGEMGQACSFTAVGAFSEAEVGFFDFSIKDYVRIPFHEQMEVLSMIGDITVYENQPKVHAHVVLGKRDGTTCGGHLLKAVVHPTLEIILTESPSWMQRQMDAESGIPLIRL